LRLGGRAFASADGAAGGGAGPAELSRRARAVIDEPWRLHAEATHARRDLDIGRGQLGPVEQRFADAFFPGAAALLARSGTAREPRDRAPDPTAAPPPPARTGLLAALGRFGYRAGTSAAPLYDPAPTAGSHTPYVRQLPQFDTAYLLAELETLVQLDHSDDGVPKAWRVIESSGDSVFDGAALVAVEDGIAAAKAASLVRLEPKPRWSRWRFSAQLYWWQKDSDKEFRPPGIEVASDGSSTTTVVRAARLVAIGFADAPKPKSQN